MGWLYKGKEFLKEDVGDHYGFVYIITNSVTGKKYIGRKYFYSKRTLPPLKGYKRKRHKVVDSGWQDYWSSSDVILAEVEKYGEENFIREIISLHRDKTSTNYHEIALQFHLNVLEAVDDKGERIFYNNNILTKFYSSKKYHDERIQLHEEYQALANTHSCV